MFARRNRDQSSLTAVIVLLLIPSDIDPKRMKRILSLSVLALGLCGISSANANLLLNGSLDLTQPVEIVPGFFLPKPTNWVNEGFRSITGPYEDEMSSEPWAGPAPTPVTTGGELGQDYAVFFKAFSGNGANGAMTGHLYQDVIATPGMSYTLTGWAGAEANLLASGAELALEFFDSGNSLIQSSTTSLFPSIFVDNGQPFNYKQFTVSGIAPVNTAYVRSRVSILNGIPNPAGGGQAFVVDDFELTAVPEPGSTALGVLSVLGAFALRSRKSKS